MRARTVLASAVATLAAGMLAAPVAHAADARPINVNMLIPRTTLESTLKDVLMGANPVFIPTLRKQESPNSVFEIAEASQMAGNGNGNRRVVTVILNTIASPDKSWANRSCKISKPPVKVKIVNSTECWTYEAPSDSQAAGPHSDVWYRSMANSKTMISVHVQSWTAAIQTLEFQPGPYAWNVPQSQKELVNAARTVKNVQKRWLHAIAYHG